MSAAPLPFFGVLGPLVVRSPDGATLPMGGSRPRALLTLLLLDEGRAVPAVHLLRGVYGEQPPDGARNALQSQVSRLRLRIAATGAEVTHVAAGYRLRLPDRACVDAHRFATLADSGHRRLEADDATGAAVAFRTALELWRGEALPDVAVRTAHAARLDALRAAALRGRIAADLRVRPTPALIAELRGLLATCPLDEPLRALLMRALRDTGHPAEALVLYEETRALLAERLGTDPSAELAELHTDLLRGTTSRDVAGTSRPDVAPTSPRIRRSHATSPPDGAASPRHATSRRGAATSPPYAPDDATSPTVPHSLPVPLTEFIGRDRERAALTALLADPDRRLVTLTGPGGAGKTRLAVETARAVAAPVRYVELATLEDGAQVPHALLTALGVRDAFLGPVGDDALGRLLTSVGAHPVLFVLDNCEHLVADVARCVASLLAGCGGARVLATSREALGLTGEYVRPVRPLPLPDAVRLFEVRAAAVRPPRHEGWSTTHEADTGDTSSDPGASDERDVIRRICVRLDGLPLAVELAAARVRTLSPRELEGRLSDRFALLSRGDRTAAPRHRTLRAVVAWSWELLDARERQLARRVSVFVDGADAATIAEVCSTPTAADLLDSLVEKSFLEVRSGRYRMLQTIRDYCAGQLAAEDDTERLRDAHAAWFLRLAEESEPLLHEARQVAALDRLMSERHELDAALRHLCSRAPDRALRMVAALAWFWRLRGLHGGQVGAARALLAVLGDIPPPGLAEEYALCLCAATSEDLPVEERRALTDRANALLEGLTTPVRHPAVGVLWSLAGGPREWGDESAGWQLSGSPWARSLLLLGTGLLETEAGRPHAAEATYREALRGFRALGDRWGIANTLDRLAYAAEFLGRRAEALVMLDEALELTERLRSSEEHADMLTHRAEVLLRARRPRDAEADLRRAEAAYRRYGLADKVGVALRGLGDVARHDGAASTARERYAAALKLFSGTWFGVAEEVRALLGLVRTDLDAGEVARARDGAERARAKAATVPVRSVRAETYEVLARLYVAESGHGTRTSGAARSAGTAASRELLRGAAEHLGHAEALWGVPAVSSGEGSEEAGLRATLGEALGDAAYRTAWERGSRAEPEVS
ncbi:AfsR/SARP family transcriptional regulator [Streptomyces sp. NPDC088923]|uniref:AfsR/SARP family transcriptional regulator n=1 Tax=Streptomyces sp. NPDC088923 TaxID=3365913 RepID=UPI003809CE8F